MTFKVIIAGGRDFRGDQKHIGKVKGIVFTNHPPEDVEIVSGGAMGADKFGELFAKSFNLSLKLFPADWNTYGKGAGFIRNSQMADYADALIAFWDGKSKGTMHMIAEATLNELQVQVIDYE